MPPSSHKLIVIQAQADVLWAYAVSFSMQFAFAKLPAFYISMDPSGHLPSFSIHDSLCQTHRIPFHRVGSFTYLGAHIPFEPSLAYRQSLRRSLSHCLGIVSRRRASASSKLLAVTAAVLPRFTYRGSLSSWTLQQFRALDSPQEHFYRQITRNTATFPTLLLYMSASGGLPRVWVGAVSQSYRDSGTASSTPISISCIAVKPVTRTSAMPCHSLLLGCSTAILPLASLLSVPMPPW